MKYITRNLLPLMLAAVIFLEVPLTGYGASKKTQQQIDSLKEQQEETQGQLDDAAQKKKNLEASKKKLENYLIDLNNQFAALSDELNDLENQLAVKQEELTVMGEELEAAKEREEKQYADMKKRIQFGMRTAARTTLRCFWRPRASGNF